MHVIHLMANNSSVPYFNWFAEFAAKDPEVKMSFIAMHRERPNMLDDMQARGADCYWIPFNDAKRKGDMLRAFPQLLKLFRKVKPDVVHSHLFDDSLPAQLAARMAGVPVRVITKQDTTYHYYYQPKYVRFDRFNNRNATHIHAVATENRKFILEKEGAPANKVHLIRNGFPYDKMTAWTPEDVAELKDRFQLHDRFVVGTVARLIDWKGHRFIVEAASRLVMTYPDLKFIFAGTGDPQFKAELQQQIDAAGLQDHVQMLDWIERWQMPSLYRCMNLYLHPALREPFGFAISEALMNQVPVAACPTGSVDLIKHQEEGYILEENNVDDIVKALRFFREDVSRCQTIAHAGHQHALDNLQFSNMWKGHIELYRSALEDAKK
ncbi:MAG: glycosyltransferase family 4 protein [Salibacteraceae bacterium]